MVDMQSIEIDPELNRCALVLSRRASAQALHFRERLDQVPPRCRQDRGAHDGGHCSFVRHVFNASRADRISLTRSRQNVVGIKTFNQAQSECPGEFVFLKWRLEDHFPAIWPIFSAHLAHSSPSRFRTVRADP